MTLLKNLVLVIFFTLVTGDEHTHTVSREAIFNVFKFSGIDFYRKIAIRSKK